MSRDLFSVFILFGGKTFCYAVTGGNQLIPNLNELITRFDDSNHNIILSGNITEVGINSSSHGIIKRLLVEPSA